MKKIFPKGLLLFVLFVSACSRPVHQDNSIQLESTLPSVIPTEPSIATSTTVPAQSILTAGNHNLAMTVDGLERTYILHVPPAASEPLPLIIVLHGTYGTGRKMQAGLGVDPYADSRGFYVVYPDAYQKPGERETARWKGWLCPFARLSSRCRC